MRRACILLGGIGGDSHSVGLLLLRRALSTRGWHVHYLSTQNPLDVFFERAKEVDLVMISCMDGHAAQYLKSFPEQYRHMGTQVPWYLGGNPAIDASAATHRRFVEMGFRRVFLHMVDLEAVVQSIESDLRDLTSRPRECRATSAVTPKREASARNTRLEMGDFSDIRGDVLDHWPTGAGAQDLEDNAAFLRSQPSLASAHRAAKSGHAPPLVQPRCGVALPEEQADLFQALSRSGASCLSFQIDSLTRNNSYGRAEEAIAESRFAGQSLLNGFPLVNHGVEKGRQIVSRTTVPVQCRHSTRDPRLLAEISMAAGLTGFEGGAICYNVPYYRDYDLSDAIEAWQYVDRLVGHYAQTYDVDIDREFFGVLTATLIPPSLAIATGILEAALAAEQGVRSVSIGYAEQGNRVQDVAAIRSIAPLARELLRELGQTDVSVSAVYHQYMAAFPPQADRARELIFQSSVTASIAGATRMLTKTPVEAWKIPSIADNSEGLALSWAGIRHGTTERVHESEVTSEMRQIRTEVRALVDGVVAMGDGDIALGIVRAFAAGALDIPFAPSIHTRNEVVTARDLHGGVRFLDCGNLPFDSDTRAWHSDLMQQRRRAEGIGLRDDAALVERDVMKVPRGQYDRWPLRLGTEHAATA